MFLFFCPKITNWISFTANFIGRWTWTQIEFEFQAPNIREYKNHKTDGFAQSSIFFFRYSFSFRICFSFVVLARLTIISCFFYFIFICFLLFTWNECARSFRYILSPSIDYRILCNISDNILDLKRFLFSFSILLFVLSNCLMKSVCTGFWFCSLDRIAGFNSAHKRTTYTDVASVVMWPYCIC